MKIRKFYHDILCHQPISNICLGKPTGKKTKVAKRLAEKREKFLNSAWKLFSYGIKFTTLKVNSRFTHFFLVFFVGYGLFAIQSEYGWFWNPYEYHLPYPSNKVPERILNFYALETGYYLYSTVAVFFEPRMKDRNQMFVHHIFTSFLLVSSYLGNTTKFGVPIMLLHDVADPPMEMAKLCIYTGVDTVYDMMMPLVFMNVFV